MFCFPHPTEVWTGLFNKKFPILVRSHFILFLFFFTLLCLGSGSTELGKPDSDPGKNHGSDLNRIRNLAVN